ncbi:MAG TPA: RluA family pseudouridine synthase [Rhodocyclaceae bacterium]|nr:RluA family pseudouridine synthase [Rhodocyclaceae bacterium]HRQ48077.1 RluA family pseudouridine synthase [Rhodocyclaceae bacterium]
MSDSVDSVTRQGASQVRPSVRRERVDDSVAGQRIDNYLLRICKGVPKSHVYRILRSGEVRVNGGRVGPTYRLAEGDEVRIPPVRIARPESTGSAPPGRPLAVVHEDEALLVVDKPAGKAVHGGSGVSFGVIEQLRSQRPAARLLELVHRIDRETSGLLIIAKKRASLKAMHDMMREGLVEKHYLALVAGRWSNPLQHIKEPLFKYLTPEGERRVRVSEEGKLAHSVVRLVRRWPGFSLLDVELKTGRTHQIRVHLAHLGFPLCGDDKYGDFALNKRLEADGLKRMFLHAAKLSFTHPLTGEKLVLASELPPELKAFIDQLDGTTQSGHG